MEPHHKDIIRKHRLDLATNINIDEILHFLYQEDILTLTHVEEIQAQTSSKKRTLMLLDILPTRGPTAFRKFLESLEAEYPWVQEKLSKGIDESAAQVIVKDDWTLPDSVLHTVPTERQLNQLANRLGWEWESLLLDLGLSAQDVYRCRANHPQAINSQVLAGLVLWKQRSGREATVQVLTRSLQAAELHPSILDQIFL